MTLAPREKILAGAIGGLVLLIGAYFLLFAGDSRTTEQLDALRDKVNRDLTEQHAILATAKLDKQRQTDWQHRSLPANPLIARSVYQKWLLDLATKSKLKTPKIANSETNSRRDQFVKLAFTLKASASIGDIVDFMYGFYTVGYLHQIRTFDVKPLQNSHDLEVTMAIEVLALPDAVAKDKLPTEPGKGLQFKTLADYEKPITKRNLFAPYVPTDRGLAGVVKPPPPPPPPPPPVHTIDPADRAFVTGFTEVDGVQQIWLMDRLAGKSWTLQVGETFRVGKGSGVVRSIESDGEAVIEYDGTKRLLHDGDSLRGGVELKGSGKTFPTSEKFGAVKADRGN